MDKRGVFWLLVSFAVVAIAGVWSGFYTAEAQREWFVALNKPALYPPSSVFAIVWPVLYALMAVAAWLVGQKAQEAEPHAIAAALGTYTAALLLQVAWCYVFFFAQRFGWAVAVLGLCWLAVLLSVWTFFRVSRVAGLLLAPLFAWSSFALYLGFGIAYHHSDFLRDVLGRLAS